MSRPPFLTNTRGEVERVGANVGIALSGDEWAGVLGWDEFRQCVVVRKPPPFLAPDARVTRATDEWTDVDTTRTVHLLGRLHRLFVTRGLVDDAVANAALSSPYNPVAEWMGSLEWDGEKRLTHLFPRYFGAEDTPYHRGIARCWMVSAVARTYRPGCQCDYLIVLQGSQGVGKTSALRALVGKDWFSETPLDIGSKEGILAQRGRLVICFDELDGLRGKAAIERVKNFLTRTTDDVRPHYGTRYVKQPRRLVFAATTNEETPFTDPTGNRRFWPVQCGDVDVAGLTADRDQLWAEAVALFKRGSKWHPGPDLAALCVRVQEDATQRNPLEDIVAGWLGGRQAHIARSQGVTTAEVLVGVLGVASTWKPGDGQAVAGILRRLGYVRKQVRTGAIREWRFQPPGMLTVVTAVTDGDRKPQSSPSCPQVTTVTRRKERVYIGK